MRSHRFTKPYNWKNYKFGIVALVGILSIFGILVVGSAKESLQNKQILGVVIGLAAMIIVSLIDYMWIINFYWVLYILSIIMLTAVKLFGENVNGATRWIRFGSIGVQPADVCKPAVIMMVSSAVCSYGTKLKKFRYVMLICILTGGVEAALVFVISNNMSSAIIIFLIAFVQTFIAYPGYKIYVALTGLVAAGVGGIYAWLTNMIKGGNMTESFRLNRLLVWINPENYASDKGFQTVQALYAIGSGGLFGKGLGKSLQKLGYIPESQNDMIFSIICEEIGLFGAIFVIIVFGVMLWRIAHVAQNAPDLFGTLLVSGVFAHIAIQVVLNIAVVTNFIPNTGVSLPFISYGGTSETILLAEIGLVLNVSSKIRLES